MCDSICSNNESTIVAGTKSENTAQHCTKKERSVRRMAKLKSNGWRHVGVTSKYGAKHIAGGSKRLPVRFDKEHGQI